MSCSSASRPPWSTAAAGRRLRSVSRKARSMRASSTSMPLAGRGRDEDPVRVAEAQLLAALFVDPVGLVEHEQPGPLARSDLVEDVVDRAQHQDHLVLVHRGVDDVDDQVGEARLLERRAERVDELVGQLADEADRVGQEIRTAVEAHRAGVRVERVEQPVAHTDGRARERVEQRRLAGVRVAGERDLRQVAALALGAHDRARALHVAQLAPQRRDPVAREAAVGLELGLARAAGPDAALAAPGAETLEVRPQAAHPREVVLELGELDLELALRALRVPGEDVEDDRGPVDDRHPELLLEVAALARRQLVVDRDEVRVGRLGLRLDLLELARPEVGVRVRLVAVLDDLSDGRDARGGSSSRSSERSSPSWRAPIAKARCFARPVVRPSAVRDWVSRPCRPRSMAPVQSRSHREARGTVVLDVGRGAVVSRRERQRSWVASGSRGRDAGLPRISRQIRISLHQRRTDLGRPGNTATDAGAQRRTTSSVSGGWRSARTPAAGCRRRRSATSPTHCSGARGCPRRRSRSGAPRRSSARCATRSRRP